MSGEKLAIVTGASSGIGRETAMVLASRGFTVRSISLGRADIEETHRRARERSLDVQVFEGDVSDWGQLARFKEWIGEKHPPLKALCNNAAIRPVGTVLTTS